MFAGDIKPGSDRMMCRLAGVGKPGFVSCHAAVGAVQEQRTESKTVSCIV